MVAVGLHLVNNHGGRLPGIGGQRVQPLPVACHPHGNAGNALQVFPQRIQVVQRPLQFFPVVDPRAENQLTIQMNAALCQPLQNREALAGKAVPHHLAAQFRIGGMHRYIDRTDMHVENPLHFPLAQIGQGDIISKKEGQAGIVVFKIQAFAHPFGQLVDKTENAPVTAGALPIHQIRLELQPDGIVLALSQGNRPLFSLLTAQQQMEVRFRLIKAEIQNVRDFMPIHGHQRLSGAYPGLFRRAAGVHSCNPYGHSFLPFSLYFSLSR